MPAPKYVMPPARVGFGIWYPSKGDQPIACIITDVGSSSVSLTVWAPDNRGGLPKDGVRHISDPEVDKMAGYTAGVWDYSPEGKILNTLTADLESMKTTLVKLLDAFGGDINPAG